MNAALQELRFASRQLRRNPGFTAITALSYRSPEQFAVVKERIPLASPEPHSGVCARRVALRYE